MDNEAQTEEPDAPPSEMGEATDPPTLFLFMIWLPVFAVVAWGMMLIFGKRPWDFSPGGIQLPPHPDGEPLVDPEEPGPGPADPPESA